MIVSDLATKVMTRLAVEAGSSDWWTTAEIKQSIKDLYREVARDLRCVKGRDDTTDSIDNTARYVLSKPTGVDTILEILSVSYDGDDIDATTVGILNSHVDKWRTLSGGTPWSWFFERGDENTAISFVPPCGADGTEIAYEFSYVPSEPADVDTPHEPFADGMILFEGVMAIALGKAGGGRDLDRSDWYFSNFASKVSPLTKHITPQVHVLGSTDDSQQKVGLRLGSHYPTYTFD
jgi:hypothetical protein